MKKLMLIIFLMTTYSCGSDQSNTSGYGRVSNLKISCFDVSNSFPNCIDPYISLDQTRNLYYPVFKRTEVIYSSPIIVWFTLTNDTGYQFLGESRVNVTLSSIDLSVTSNESFSFNIDILPSSSQTFSMSLSSNVTFTNHGTANLAVYSPNGSLENESVKLFFINY